MKKHYNKTNLKQAFSIIEIAIVIVIIGVLIVGIVKGKDLYIAAKSSTAKNITTNSYIVRIKSLSTWHESSVTDFGLGDQLKDDSILRNWPDISPFGKGLSRGQSSLVCSSAGDCKYIEDGISNIPTVNFVNNAVFTGNTNFSAVDNYAVVLIFSLANKTVNQRIVNIGNISINYLVTNEKLSIFDGTNFSEVVNFPAKCQSVPDSFVCAVIISKQNTDVANNFIYVNSLNRETIQGSATLPSFQDSSILTIAGPAAVATASIPALTNFSGNFSEIILFNDYFSEKEMKKLMTEYVSKKYSLSIRDNSQVVAPATPTTPATTPATPAGSGTGSGTGS